MADATACLKAYASGRALLKTLSTLDEPTRATITSQAARLLEEASSGKENSGVHANQQTPALVLETALCTVPDISLQNPKGKFTLSVYQDSLTFSNSKSDLRIPRDGIQDVVILEGFPKDQKGRLLLLLTLTKEAVVTFGKQQLDALVIQTFESAQLTVPMQGSEVQAGPAAVVMCTLLGKMGVKSYLACDSSVFSSSIGSSAMVATHKVTPGFLFPLPSALCFVEKPALLLPHTSIQWVELLRIDRPTATFDLIVHLQPGSHPQGRKVALDQLERSELSRLQAYLAACRIKTSMDSHESGSQRASTTGPQQPQPAAQAEADMDGDESEEDDEDFDPQAAGSDSDQGSDDDDDGDDGSGSEEQEGAGRAKGGKADNSRGQQRAPQTTSRKPAEDDEEDIGEEEDDEDEEDEEDEYEDDSDNSMEEEEPLEPVEEPPAKRSKARA